MRNDLDKNYNPKTVEDRLYKQWLERKYFQADADKSKKPYTIMMPPANITGKLHIGHALTFTMQDILIRTKRMQGYNALWMPGTDHASISTEVRIVNEMAAEGITKSQLGREGFLKRAWEWKALYGGAIVNQLKLLGSSCDWDRERFTMDEGLSKAVTEVFLRLYNKGYIYKGMRLVNWCGKCRTTISDAEVEHEDIEGYFWHFKYKIKDTDEYISFATTRPETMLGDTAVAVNPEDERYSHLIGKTVTVPIVNRDIPIIADKYVEKDFGTGVVKITPAHDPNDFEVGERHKLPSINIFNDDGTLNENTGKYAGLYRYTAREKIVEEFKELGLFIKAEKLVHAVGVHDRCGDIIEPMIKLQWFVRMDELAKPAMEVYKNGSMKIVPDRFGKVYMNWLENIRDWCISRQLWWGHRIPAYYCKDCGNMHVSAEAPELCSKCGSKALIQDEDTLDTWFSSALWPFSTLGWPEETEDLKYFYPTDVLVTAYDILFFWVIRMVFSGLEQMGDIPFKDVLIHGLVRDANGKKMSKSSDNGIDPLEIIDKYGADALRLTLVMGSAPGNDTRLYVEKIESNRNFLNKIWNAARFVLMNLDGDEPVADEQALEPADKWILSGLNSLCAEVIKYIDGYDLGAAVQSIYDFFWDEYCDWYIEMVKTRLYNKNDSAQSSRNAALWTLKRVLEDSLKLLHPFMPFITEEIFTNLTGEDTIMLGKWPEYDERLNFANEEKEIDMLKEAVKNIRNIRAEMNVPLSKRVKLYIVSEDDYVKNVFKKSMLFFQSLSTASEVVIQNSKEGISANAVSIVNSGSVTYIPFEELIDAGKELERLGKERNRLISEVERVEKKLANQGFMSKAPAEIVAEENEKLAKYKGMLSKTEEQIELINNM